MNKFGNLSLLLVMLLFSATTFASKLTVEVDRKKITENEHINLVIKYHDFQSSGSPDLSPLRTDFDIIRSGFPTQQKIIMNGQTTAFTSWNITLLPKRTGMLTIPKLTFIGQSSKPFQIQVVPLSQQIKDQQNKYILFDVSVSNETPYVQEPFLYFLKIYYAKGINNPELINGIDFPDCDFEEIDERKYQSTIKGQQYTVYELSARITPLKSGALRVQPLKMTAEFYRSRFSRPQQVTQASKGLDLTVKPIPSSFPKGAEWLPATSLRLEERWSQLPTKVSIGQTYTRQIITHAAGLQAKQLPQLKSKDITGIKRYPDKPQLEDDFKDNVFLSKRADSEAIVFTEPGEHKLPEISIPWWNTKTDTLQYAKIPERQFVTKQSPKESTSAAEIIKRIPASEPQLPARPNSQPVWKYLSIILFLTNIISMALVIYLYLYGNSSKQKEEKSSQTSSKGLTETFKSLQTAAAEYKINEFYAHLQQLMQLKGIQSSDLEAKSIHHYQKLLGYLYADKEKPQKDELVQLFSDIKSVILKQNTQSEKSSIPPLN